jgi:hypothetical protein
VARGPEGRRGVDGGRDDSQVRVAPEHVLAEDEVGEGGGQACGAFNGDL